MASRALFNTQLTRTLKRPGVRFNTTFNSKFARERDAVKEHAGSMYHNVSSSRKSPIDRVTDFPTTIHFRGCWYMEED